MLVPGYDGAFQAVPDPFEGRERHLEHPINADPQHPLSTAKGYAPLYSPGAQITNAAGEVEDTAATWLEDAEKAHENLPGMIPAHTKLYLQRPNRAGLSEVRRTDGAPLYIKPGQTIAVRVGPSSIFDTTAGLQKAVVSTDPKEAAEFFRKSLPPGWVPVQDGPDSAEGRVYTLYYGARVKVGRKELDAQIKQRGTLFDNYKANPPPEAVTTLPGGAAVTFPQLRRNPPTETTNP